MRGLASLVGLLVVALIAVLVYKYYFSKLEATGGGTPLQTINIVGVKNDLLAIAQAERAYQAQHGSYASLDELGSSGELAVKKTGRDGYTYDVEVSSDTFRAVAHCPTVTNPGCSDYSIEPSMEVQSTK
jgi:hypothetical protein